MIQDKFGYDLWACIAHCGMVLACQDQYAKAVMDKDSEGMEQRKAHLEALKSHIPILMDRLSTEDAAMVARCYPWVTNLG